MELKHPYYAENNSLSLIVITTVDNEREYRINCKLINGRYYVKNTHLLFDKETGKWIMKELLVFDYEKQKEVAKSNKMIHGVVNTTSEGTIEFGYFTPNHYRNCAVYLMTGRSAVCIDPKVLSEKYYIECGYGDGYMDVRGRDSTDIVRFKRRKPNSRGDNSNHNYNIEDDPHIFETAKENYKNSEFSIEKSSKFGAKLLGDLTFGIELETINGNLPQHLRNKYGIVICKDGSIKDENGYYPPEYVTVPFSGAKGLQAIRDVSGEISKRSNIDLNCSYHLHIGNIKIDRVFLVAMYSLCYKIQDEIFKMFPYYKTDPSGIKSKNYCKKLPNILGGYTKGDFNKYINSSYSDFFAFLSGGNYSDREYNRKTRRNPWGEGKWNIKSRYYWINFVNLVFSKRDTIEFRIHTPTLNSDKIINWLFICNAIAKYAQEYPYECIKGKAITLAEVMQYYEKRNTSCYASIVTKNILDYIQERKELFLKDFKANDRISAHEIINDSKYSNNILKLK